MDIMGNTKRKRAMDDAPRNTLSLIDLALADLAENTRQKRDGEFTTADISKAKGIPVGQARYEAEKMVRLGTWKSRKVDSRMSFYSRA
jgi:hypothetical protein